MAKEGGLNPAVVVIVIVIMLGVIGVFGWRTLSGPRQVEVQEPVPTRPPVGPPVAAPQR